MSRARQFAVVAAVAGTLLLATSSAAPQPWSSAVVAVRPYVCFANYPCPGPTASICFASAVVRERACPAPKVTFRFAQAPQGKGR
jgi:hypothetical protein